MTNNVEKIYELAGVSNYDFRLRDYFDKDRTFRTKVEFIEKCNFTDTKQLNLIKWLAKLGEFEFCLEIAHNSFDIFTFYFKGIRVHEHFEQALAGLVCELWEDLTPEQREEVRGILQ